MFNSGHARRHASPPVIVTTNDIKDAFTILGGALGALAFLWRLWDTLISHVRLDLELSAVDPDTTGEGGKVAVARVVIENQGITPKRIAYVALLLGPSTKTVDQLASAICRPSLLAPPKLSSQPLIDLFRLDLDRTTHSQAEDVHLVPLPFFYLDHSQIGNEKLQFKRNLADLKLPVEVEHRIYLLVFSKEPLRITRCRLTSDLLPRQASRRPPQNGESECHLHLTT